MFYVLNEFENIEVGHFTRRPKLPHPTPINKQVGVMRRITPKIYAVDAVVNSEIVGEKLLAWENVRFSQTIQEVSTLFKPHVHRSIMQGPFCKTELKVKAEYG